MTNYYEGVAVTWANWLIGGMLVVSLGGLWILRDKDKSGRKPARVSSDRQVRAVLAVLLNERNAPTSSYTLGLHTDIAPLSLYPLLVTLTLRGTLEQVAVDDASPPRRLYRLTDQGVAEAQLRGGDKARGRHRT